MLKKVFFLAVLLALAVSLAAPAGRVAAGGANRVDFTALSYPVCNDPNYYTTFCSDGTIVSLPNGKEVVVGFQALILFTNSSDPRWNALCEFTADSFSPGGTTPLMGSFVCRPFGDKYEGGWWEGSVEQVFMEDKAVANFIGKGYGTLNRLLVVSYNTMSSFFDDVPVDINNVGTITELPGYEEPVEP